jgi:hypothetical protein
MPPLPAGRQVLQKGGIPLFEKEGLGEIFGKSKFHKIRHSGESRNPVFSKAYKYPGLRFSPE